MKVSVDTGDLTRSSSEWTALVLTEGRSKPQLPADVAELDDAVGGCIRAAIDGGGFRGRAGELLSIFPAPGNRRRRATARRILLVGCGQASKLDAEVMRNSAGRIVKHTTSQGAKRVVVALPALGARRASACAQGFAEGLVLGSYRFDGHRARDAGAPSKLSRVSLMTSDEDSMSDLRAAVKRGVLIADCQNKARDLSNEPANTLPPAALARQAQRVSREVGLRCRVFGDRELQSMKMGGLLAVGGGSSRPPRLVVMEHGRASQKRSARGARPTICVIGKGITFDSGGISIKPSAAMDEMKHDMSGAATVVGALRACALLKLPLHVVGVIAAAENLPSSTAYRPGDVVRTHSGKTVEILNTDAEGRVVLADALHYANHRYKPDAMVDLATLTGACMVALGASASGLFCENRGLSGELEAAGTKAGERAWPLPLLPEHRRAMKSNIADLKNAGARGGGASTAAGFLSEFVGDTPWAHLDIAGTAWTSKKTPIQGHGATGVGVRLLVEWLSARSA